MALNFVKTLFSNATAFLSVITTASAATKTTLSKDSAWTDTLPFELMETLLDQIIAALGGNNADDHQGKADLVGYLIKYSSLSAEDLLFTCFVVLNTAMLVRSFPYLLSVLSKLIFLLSNVTSLVHEHFIYNGVNDIRYTFISVINRATEVDYQTHIQCVRYGAKLACDISRVQIQRFGQCAATYCGIVKIQIRAMINWFDTWLKDIYMNYFEPKVAQLKQKCAEECDTQQVWNEIAHNWNNFLRRRMIDIADTVKADATEIDNAAEAIRVIQAINVMEFIHVNEGIHYIEVIHVIEASEAAYDNDFENITGNFTATPFRAEDELTPNNTDDEWEVDEYDA
jgi:hypothetical protein